MYEGTVADGNSLLKAPQVYLPSRWGVSPFRKKSGSIRAGVGPWKVEGEDEGRGAQGQRASRPRA